LASTIDGMIVNGNCTVRIGTEQGRALRRGGCGFALTSCAQLTDMAAG